MSQSFIISATVLLKMIKKLVKRKCKPTLGEKLQQDVAVYVKEARARGYTTDVTTDVFAAAVGGETSAGSRERSSLYYSSFSVCLLSVSS